MSQPHSHIPYGPDGEGQYSSSVQGCFDVIENATPLVTQALENIPFDPSDGAFTMCDYGTADGGTSIFLFGDCIKWLKERYGADLQVSVLYEDQPVNDFKSVFMRLQGLLPGPKTYYEQYSGVYVSAVGTSFYSQCVPDNSVHLGFSATALHWLSKRPVVLEDAMHHTYTKNAAQRQMFADQAALDWERIMLHRAKELTKGGQMVIACFCVDNDGNHFGGRTPYASKALFEQLMECWSEMEAEGRITEEERRNLQLDNYYRSEAEFSAPFKAGSPVYEAGLRLVSIRTQFTRCPYHLKWVTDGKKGDKAAAKEHAKWSVNNSRVWSNSSFVSALSDSRSKAEKDQIVDDFFGKYEARIAAAPEDHSIDYFHAFIHIKKE